MLKQSLLLLTGSQEPAALRLKQALLITHGTVYGYTVPAALAREYSGISASITSGWAMPWRSALYPSLAATPALFGPLTDHSPIDFIHWDAGAGVEPPSALFPWQQCLTLLTRL